MVAGASAVNTGVTAAAFFAFREYIIGPTLVYTAPGDQYARRRRQLGIDPPNDASAPISFSEIRANKMLDSGLSGAVTGALLRGYRSGRRAVLPGALTAAAACLWLQYAYNELSISRLKYVSQMREDAEAAARLPVAIPETASDSSSIKDHLLILIGLRKMPEGEYLEKMKKTRDTYQKRIAVLEQQLAEEREQKAREKDAEK
ncbi:hypothetical protein BDQ12DRAFT_675962 [Crucibulum laeve]|uniref:Uncharacterized protein n=1 Tax=Crucibulum laeve TaxID=68775 RepID=A0A5C3MD27_9AGAR|nr:hypothetical protein BDQ12DRAFT_675962 [Crucibulum laeve]